MKKVRLPSMTTLGACLLAHASLVVAQSAVADLSNFAQGIVQEHNRVRQAENAGLAPLTWSPELASFAQNWANQLQRDLACGMQHRSGQQRYLNGQITGENLFQARSGRPYSGFLWRPEGVVQAWASEKPYYSFATKRCSAGQMCGHYTQVVWGSTKQVGCGRAQCGTSEVWVCNYLPAGNYIGMNPY